MGVMDFLLGKPSQQYMDPRTQASRDFILDELNRLYGQGPINVPKYFAEVPETQYSGTNSLLSALGLDTVLPPQMDTVDIGGINAYSSEPLQAQIEADFAQNNPSLYNELMDRVRPQGMTASLQPVVNSGGGDSSPMDNAQPRYATAQAFDRFGATDMVDKYANPSYSPDLAIANKAYKNITSDDFSGASLADQYKMMGQSMNAAGIRNVGGGYAQPASSFGQDLKNMANKIGSDIKNKTLIGRIFGGGR
jgi:hypothetical protein